MKKVLIIVGIVVVLLVAGVAILVANLDSVVNSKKDYILDKAETAVGRVASGSRSSTATP